MTVQKVRYAAIMFAVAILILILHVLTCVECTVLGTLDSVQKIFQLFGCGEPESSGQVGILVRKYQVRTPGV